jgi:hypothetical protein
MFYDVLEITKAAFTEISVQNWENYCKHVINVEEEYTRKDIVIDQEIDNFVKLSHTSSMGFKSGWYGGSRRIICPFSFAMSSIIYCGSGLFAFAKANNSGRNSFLSNGILCFDDVLEITKAAFTEISVQN